MHKKENKFCALKNEGDKNNIQSAREYRAGLQQNVKSRDKQLTANLRKCYNPVVDFANPGNLEKRRRKHK